MSENPAPAASVDSLVFRPMQPTEDDLRLFLKCFNDNGLPRSIDLLRWQYLEPPAGKLYVDVAMMPAGDGFAAIYATFPVAMRAAGRRADGVQSLNTLTDEAFRGKGLFSRMAKAVYARCRDEGVALVYGFPNGNSAHGFFNRLEWKSLDPMPFMIRPLRTGYVLRRLRAGWLARVVNLPLTLSRKPKLTAGRRLTTVAAIGPEFDAVWNAFAASIGFAVERDAEYLAWRLRRPGEDYECIALMEGERPIGLAITGVKRGAKGEVVGKLMELMFDPADEEAGKALVRTALARLSAAGCGAAWAWNFEHSPNHAVLRGAGFVTLPPKWHPDELHAGARPFAPLEGIEQRDRWYVSLLDSDTD
jgi:GNAT superfamily N-acetyltransferase